MRYITKKLKKQIGERIFKHGDWNNDFEYMFRDKMEVLHIRLVFEANGDKRCLSRLINYTEIRNVNNINKTIDWYCYDMLNTANKYIESSCVIGGNL